jgi:hypothetical protein
MRLLLLTAAACGFSLSVAAAQDMPAQNGPANAPMKAMDRNNSSSPVKGKNSFTAAQAKSAIEKRGYGDVSGLTLDSDGIWRGTASKDGHSGPVSLDYQGNVN